MSDQNVQVLADSQGIDWSPKATICWCIPPQRNLLALWNMGVSWLLTQSCFLFFFCLFCLNANKLYANYCWLLAPDLVHMHIPIGPMIVGWSSTCPWHSHNLHLRNSAGWCPSSDICYSIYHKHPQTQGIARYIAYKIMIVINYTNFAD